MNAMAKTCRRMIGYFRSDTALDESGTQLTESERARRCHEIARNYCVNHMFDVHDGCPDGDEFPFLCKDKRAKRNGEQRTGKRMLTRKSAYPADHSSRKLVEGMFTVHVSPLQHVIGTFR